MELTLFEMIIFNILIDDFNFKEQGAISRSYAGGLDSQHLVDERMTSLFKSTSQINSSSEIGIIIL